MFYKMETQTMPNGETAALPVTAYNDGDDNGSMDAEIAFHMACASNLTAIKEGRLNGALIKIIGEAGADIMTKHYNKPVEPEPVEPEQNEE